jgi:hypothetical protein
MFLKNSRYHGIATVIGKDRSGRLVTAVKLRRLPMVSGSKAEVAEGTQLDVISEQKYNDPTRYWHIADANTELEANQLVRTPGETILVPGS